GYALTYGWEIGGVRVPSLGAGGLGIASSIMMWVQAIVFALYLWRAKRFADLHLFARFDAPHWPPIRGLLATGLPIGVTVAMEGSLFIVTALLIGRLGGVPAAAHQIAINVASLCFMIPMGLAEATTVRVGHAVGRALRQAQDVRDFRDVRRAAFAGYAIMLGTQLLSGLLLLFGNEHLAALYTRDAAVAALASTLLLYAAAFQFPDGIQVLSAGALRGLKDTRVPMLLAALAYWGIGMPLGAGLGLGLGMGPRGMWIGLIIGLAAAAILLGARFLRASRTAPMS
ncbi:MAG: MATE family efflux transporter, partial [Pseudomonadota bacterium]|nr:MATE family efflux transporter [Pseudomonadota bacterium]